MNRSSEKSSDPMPKRVYSDALLTTRTDTTRAAPQPNVEQPRDDQRGNPDPPEARASRPNVNTQRRDARSRPEQIIADRGVGLT
jgi:hypothetical protein